MHTAISINNYAVLFILLKESNATAISMHTVMHTAISINNYAVLFILLKESTCNAYCYLYQ